MKQEQAGTSAAPCDCGATAIPGKTCACGRYHRTPFRADFEKFLAESGKALNDDGCLIPANTKGDGQPCECPCHRERRSHDA